MLNDCKGQRKTKSAENQKEEREREREIMREEAYRELNKPKDEHGPETPKIRIRDAATKKGEEEDSPYKVGDYVCRR